MHNCDLNKNRELVVDQFRFRDVIFEMVIFLYFLSNFFMSNK